MSLEVQKMSAGILYKIGGHKCVGSNVMRLDSTKVEWVDSSTD